MPLDWLLPIRVPIWRGRRAHINEKYERHYFILSLKKYAGWMK
jgi:hypothetical protein